MLRFSEDKTGFNPVALFLLVLVSAFMLSCATVPDGMGVYRIESVGNAQRSIRAEVLSVEPVRIIERNSGVGARAGGAMGAAIALEQSDNAAVIIAGLIAGAVIGNAIEESANIHNGHQYVIENSRGALLTIAQIDRGHDVYSIGDSVILVYGYPHKLLRDPR